MNSPYLTHAARRASIMIGVAPPLVTPLPTLSSKADCTFYDRTLPRTQREAGIEHLAWEDRAPPIETWTRSFIGGLGIVIFMLALWTVLGAF